jgi:hypothetical protein
MKSLPWLAILTFTVGVSSCKRGAKKGSPAPATAASPTPQPSGGQQGGGDVGWGWGGVYRGGFGSVGGRGGFPGDASNFPSGNPSPLASGSSVPSTAVFSGNGPGRYAADFEASPTFYSKMTTYEQTNSPHGKVKVYFSKNVESGLHQGNFSQVPLGTVAIAMFDNDGRDGNDGFAVMTKEVQSYDSANGNWSFEMRDKGGDPIAGQVGRVQSCIQCHNGFSATDHLASVHRGIVGGGPGAFQSDYPSSSSSDLLISG